MMDDRYVVHGIHASSNGDNHRPDRGGRRNAQAGTKA